MAAMRASEGGVVANQCDHEGLTCGDVLAKLGDYVDRDLAARERSRVDAHLRVCSVCERFGGRYAETVRRVRAEIGAPPAVDAEQLERIRAALWAMR